MKVVVELDDELYNDIFADREKFIVISGMRSGKTLFATLMRAIGNGKVLPKGHGRLIDADAFIDKIRDSSKRQRYNECLIDEFLTVDDVLQAVIESLENKGLAEGDASTIIEADKEGTDK